MFLSATLIPVCASSSLEFHVMCSAYKLNNQGDHVQPWHSFPSFEPVHYSMSSFVASWRAYRFCRRQVRWSGIPITLRIFHSLLWSIVEGFGVVIKAETDVFQELSCFFHDPADVGNLISGSSAFLKPAWTSGSSRFTYCWSLPWRILSITLLACEMNAIVR